MLGWKLNTFKIEKTDSKSGCTSYHYIYICKKEAGADELSE